MTKRVPVNNYFYIIFFTLIIGLTGCRNQEVNTSATKVNPFNKTNPTKQFNPNLPQVVVTTSVLCDLTRQVAGDTINLTCLIPPSKDPHTYQSQSEDLPAIQKAKLIFYNGYNLEPSLIKIIKNTKTSGLKIALAQSALPNKGNKNVDPHIWHNIKNTIKIVEIINSSLNKISPNNTKIYNSNTKQINNGLTQLDGWIKSSIASIPNKQRKLITTHNAMGYYTKAYGISYAGALITSNTDIKLTDVRKRNFIKDIKKANVPIIFGETTINPQLIESIAKQVNVRVSPRTFILMDWVKQELKEKRISA